VSELGAALHAWLADASAHDRGLRRFGARHHRYRLAPPLPAARLDAIEAELGLRLPSEYRGLIAEVGDGGAGPYHGLMPLDHPVQRAVAHGEFPLAAAAPGAGPAELAGRALYRGVVGLGHVGCGYVAFLVVRGAAAGQVWLDLRGAGEGVGPIHPDFTSYYRAWIARAARNQLPDGWVTPGRCALPAALSSYLAGRERAAGVPPGTLGDDALREALGALGPGAIRCAASGDDPFFDADEPIDPCPRCEQMIENLAARGLGRDRIAPGLPPWPQRPPGSVRA